MAGIHLRMGKWLRYILLSVLGVAVLQALGATLLEPGLAKLLEQIGIDSTAWVGPMLDLVDHPLAIIGFAAISGATVGAWGHWVALKFDDRRRRRLQAVEAFRENTGHPLSGHWTSLHKAAEIARKQFAKLQTARTLAKRCSREQEIVFFATLLHRFGEVHGRMHPSEFSELIPFEPDRPVIFRMNGGQMDSLNQDKREQYRYVHIRSDTIPLALREIERYLQDPPAKPEHPVLQWLIDIGA